MKAYLPYGQLKRRADVDLSDLTASKRTGEPHWDPVEPDMLVVPMSPEPTPAEKAEILRRLTSDNPVEEKLNKRLDDAYAEFLAFEALAQPNNNAQIAVLKLLCKVVRALIRLQRRRLDAVD
jgi:hypothetical protein